jgi:hypothetical protein
VLVGIAFDDTEDAALAYAWLTREIDAALRSVATG